MADIFSSALTLSNILDNCGYLDANVFALYLGSGSANNMIEKNNRYQYNAANNTIQGKHVFTFHSAVFSRYPPPYDYLT